MQWPVTLGHLSNLWARPRNGGQVDPHKLRSYQAMMSPKHLTVGTKHDWLQARRVPVKRPILHRFDHPDVHRRPGGPRARAATAEGPTRCCTERPGNMGRLSPLGFEHINTLGRYALPNEVAQTALFLASDDSSFFTGQWLSPNGGLLIA